MPTLPRKTPSPLAKAPALQDYTRECLGTFEATEAELREAFCFRCLRPECEKSSLNASRFSDRAENWEERLFKNPPKMAEGDPRFLPIAGQRFERAARGGWAGSPSPKGVSAQVPAQLQASQVPAPPGEAVSPLALANTLPRPPLVLPGAPTGLAAPSGAPSDPWASSAPAVLPKGERLVVPGTKIRLSGV